MTPRTIALLAPAALVMACAAPQKATWAEVQPPVA
jgi:hypothetical protein